MNTVRQLKTIFLMLALFMGAANGAWALSTTDIKIDESITHGTVTVKSVATRTVTLTVTPASGYFVERENIVVQKLQDPSLAQARRKTPAIADALTVSGPASSSGETNYTFVVPEGYAGALVTVTFTGMNPATATVTSNTLTYTGEPQALVTLGTVVGGAATDPVTYSLSSGGTYTSTIPTATNAGTYTVYYKVAGDATHAEGSGSVSVTINKAQITSVILSSNAISYDGNEHTVNVTSVKAGTIDVSSENYDVSGNTATSIGTYTVTVTAKTESQNFTGSATATFRIVEETIIIINSSTAASAVTNLGGHYLIMSNINASVLANLYNTTEDFTGTLEGGYDNDGNFYKIDMTGYNHALFNTIDGGTVKNIVLDNVTISSGTNVGAICNEATGATNTTRIYNCGILSGSVSGSTNVGGLVGLISADSKVRVVNCYNFGSVSASGSGSYAAGIVGRNSGTVGDVRIALCMMYGTVSGATNISPVYAGNHTSNAQNYTEYNYWRSKANISYTAYNDQLAIDKDEYLTRFPFYRHILNTHRELAAFFLFGETGESVSDITTDEVAEIGHWVLKKDVAQYPIVEEWKTNTKRATVDIKANLPTTTDDRKGKLLTNMGNNGYLTVNVYINGSKVASPQLPITDMNEDNYDYTWGKVVLPFANEFSGWTRDYRKVCTGWEITSISGGTAGTFEHYDVANRDCTAKDLYANSNYIFAQGGNYIVPYGVKSIDVNAHFANAFYLSDASYDVGYDANFANPAALGGSVSVPYHEETVYTDLTTLVSALATTNNPHDQAIVLVGNFHYRVKDANGVLFNTGKAVTIMSVDEDCNQEPDYGWYMGNTHGRLEVPPLRFDFVPIIEMGLSSRVGSNLYPGIGIWHTRGWFELTETCVSNMTQCEINSDNFTNSDDGKGNNRWIANSGCFVQIVRARDGACNKLSYIQIGGNAYVKELYPGSHTDNARESVAVPIAVTGGQVDECFMTGYKAGATLTGNMIYFWCAGGKIKKFLGAYLEEPTAAGMTAKVDHALIGRFFGGGTSSSARIKGNIDITINNSKVDFYCGGPEFGDIGPMVSNKINHTTVTTHATGTTFGEYYGAGFGGTSITYNREEQNNSLNITNTATTTFDLSFSSYYKRLVNKASYGLGCCYKFEYIFHSNGNNGVTRFYTGYAQFDLATTGNVTNVLNNCKIKKLDASSTIISQATSGDFYGAGCQGMVDGTVGSTLTNCTIEGSAYGGGFKAEANEVEVYTTESPTYSYYTKETGIFSDFVYDFKTLPNPEIYTWESGTAGTSNTTKKELYTNANLSDLGNVTGNITLTIDGDSKIGSTTTGGALVQNTGNVFGGGNESKSLSNTTVNLKGNTEVLGNVFGGGNEAEVNGTATVNIQTGN